MSLTVACSPLQHFPTLYHKRHDFRKTVTEQKICVSSFSTTFVRNIFHSKNNWARYDKIIYIGPHVKGRAVPLQAWTVPGGSRKLRFPDFVTTTQDRGRLSALRTGRLYPQGILLVLISVRGRDDPRAIVRSEWFYVNEKSTDTSWDRTFIFRFVAQHLKPLCYRGPRSSFKVPHILVRY